MKTDQWKPNDIALLEVPSQISTRQRLVEIISRPIPVHESIHPGEPCNKTYESILVRMVPGDPTTMQEVALNRLHRPFGKYKYVHIANVYCKGFSFPEDMLRYDGAFLLDCNLPEEPVDDMGRHLFRPMEPVTIYRLTVLRSKPNPWTTARWHSFGVGITHVASFDLRKEPFTRAG